MLTIDGSVGEGGGQILRSAIGLALVSGTPVRIHSIRAKRAKPGLMRQHLTAVRAAAEVAHAEVTGAEIGSRDVTFRPKSTAQPGSYTFNVGSAGSTTLVLQTVLPALAIANAPSSLVLEGGTHNPMAPPFDFLDRAFLPLLSQMGPRVTASIEVAGFYPAGGGRIHVSITPSKLARLDLRDRGEIREKTVVAAVANLPIAIARREVDKAREVLGWEESCFRLLRMENSPGPGNVMTIEVRCDHVTEVFTGIGEKGLLAEIVAERAAKEARAWLESGAPVGQHLADQLLLPMALAGGGSFRTIAPSLHARTQMDLLERILGVRTIVAQLETGVFHVEVGSR